MSIHPCRIVVASVSLIALVASFPGSSTGQEKGLTPVPRLFGAFSPELGAWSEYSVVEKDTGKRAKMRMSIVGTEGDAFWYEVFHDDTESTNVIKMLVKGNPNDPENIKRMIFKSGDNPAAEMPPDFVAMGRKMAVHMFEKRSGVSAQPTSPFSVKEVGEEKVTVTAGTFKTSLYSIIDENGKAVAKYYSSPTVLPFGVVSSDTEQTSMELLAYGRDARSMITGTPAMMTTPPGMPKGMPRGVPPGMPRPRGGTK
jgi:hypothetical protein